jgi:WD40 repeat protein
MKCLEKDRTRRYETANGLAADLKRHLGNEPVIARPPSRWYEFQKTVRRHKFGFAATAAVILALGLGVVVSTRQALRAGKAERDTATALEALEEIRERERRDAYFHRISLAHREISVDNLGRALDLLGECPDELRDWEWYYLDRYCRIEPLVLRDTNDVHAVSFHPDGDRVAVGCADGTIKIWDLNTGEVVQTLPGHERYVFSVAFSSHPQRLASASADRTIRVWDLATGKEVFRRTGHTGDYAGMSHMVALSTDGQLVVAGGEDGFATIWDATDGREVHRLPEQHEPTAACSAFDRDGRLLATGSWAGVLRIWDVATGQLLHSIQAHEHRLGGVAFSPDGRHLATASFDRTVKIWNAETGDHLHTLRGHTDVVSGVAWSHDGRRLFSCGGDKRVKVWDPRTGREILDLRGHEGVCSAVAVSPGGERVASTGGDGTIRIWDATPLRQNAANEPLTIMHESEVWSAEFTRDGKYVATGIWTGPVQLWDARSGSLEREFEQPEDIGSTLQIALSPDGSRLAAASRSRKLVALFGRWETATGREVGEEIREKGHLVFFVAFDPTGDYLIREGPDFTIQVREVRTGALAGVVGRHDAQIWGAAFSPDGRRLATASNDRTVRVWAWNPAHFESEQEAELTLQVRVAGFGNRVAFSSDGRHLATGGEKHSVKIWEATTGELIETLIGHTGDVYAVACSPDGRWLATAGEDTTVRIWDAESWQFLHTLRGHLSLVGTLSFDRNSQRLASGGRDGMLKIWERSQWDNQSARD